ncbi:MAG: radical SAM protein [Campylobacterota bacterium]
MKNPIIFGPVASRRFGISLGIDLSPDKKQCNFDCLYCELDKAKTVSEMTDYPSVNEIIEQIKHTFSKNKKIDVITLTANGEPTLYPYLNELIDEINRIKGKTKTLILSNGSTIYKEETYNALLKIDTVKLSLDCISSKCFKKLDRIDDEINIEKIVPAMVSFSKQTLNNFVIEILFVKTLNDKEEELKLLYKALQEINPHRIDIGTIDRPPAYDVKPVDYQYLEYVANYFESLNTNIVYKNRPKQLNSFTKNEIINTLKRRPMTLEDINNLLDKNSKNILEELVKDNTVKIINSSGVEFHKIS